MTKDDLIVLLQAARHYISQGLVIAPVLLRRDPATNKKKPTILYRYSDLNPKSYDWDFFKKLCRAYSNRSGYFNSLMLLVDKTPGLIVVDCDSPQAVSKIESLLTATRPFRSRTPRGGIHFWFRTEKERQFFQCQRFGFDVPRTIYVPGSRVENADKTVDMYHWIDKSSIPTIPTALEAYLSQIASGIKELDKPAERGPGVSIIDLESTRAAPGTRHRILCSIAGKLKSPVYGFSRDETLRYVLRLNSRVDFQKPATEVHQLVNWIYDH